MLKVTSARLDRVAGVVVAAAHRPLVVDRVLDADLPDVDVLPAKARAVAAAEARARVAARGQLKINELGLPTDLTSL